MQNELTQKIKSELWSKFSTKNFPSEWDGRNPDNKDYCGGKLSQRFWEYFKAIELLDLDQNSVVLDIGGGSPDTGSGAFAWLLSKYIKKIIVMDPNLGEMKGSTDNIKLVKKNANREELKKLFSANPDITHIVSVSVFEHIEPSLRMEIVEAINDFKGNVFVVTLEYHPKKNFWNYQLTTKTVSELFKKLTTFYLSEFHSSPTLCEGAFVSHKDFHRYKFLPRAIRKVIDKFLYHEIPGWYPVILKFERSFERKV
jgi:ubiquinone/menaquinone biosynthesis C-methylase UbiE